MNLGATELIIVLAVVLLLFGSTRLPKLARSLGQASKEFKKGVSEDHEDEKGLTGCRSPSLLGNWHSPRCRSC
jgi:sec-independent protein translocase protein TatA